MHFEGGKHFPMSKEYNRDTTKVRWEGNSGIWGKHHPQATPGSEGEKRNQDLRATPWPVSLNR
jgi:hypothetical protein